MDPLSAVRHLPVLVRWHNPPECQARRQPDIPVRCRVELVRAQSTPPARQASIVQDFKKACEARDIDALVGLLDPGATAIADTGALVWSSAHTAADLIGCLDAILLAMTGSRSG
jgi:hypothetical protein